MPVSPNFIAYVLEQLAGLGALRSRRMFGGIGLYCDDLFFGLIDDDILYFKVDDSNREMYVSRGCQQFRPFPDDPNTVSMSYYRVPEDVIEDSDEARAWARKSIVIASAVAVAKSVKKTKKNKTANLKAKTSRRSSVTVKKGAKKKRTASPRSR